MASQRRAATVGVPSDTSIFDVNAVYGDPPICSRAGRTFLTICQIFASQNGPAKAHVRSAGCAGGEHLSRVAVQCFTDDWHMWPARSADYLLDLIGKPRPSISRVWNTRITELRMTPIHGKPAVYAMLRMVAEKSGWGKRKHGKGTGVGIAAHRSFLTYVATVV